MVNKDVFNREHLYGYFNINNGGDCQQTKQLTMYGFCKYLREQCDNNEISYIL